MSRHAILDVFERITTRAPFVRPKAIELFCGNGMMQAIEYAKFCDYIEGWDLKEKNVQDFKQAIPSSKVKCVDTFEEIKNPRDSEDVKWFDLVCIDNSALTARNGNFEHFNLFPFIFKLMNPAACFVVFTVYPDPFTYAETRRAAILKAFGSKADEFMVDWDAARDKFYELPPLDPANLPKHRPVSSVKLSSMEDIYKEKFEAAGFVVPYVFSCMRGRAAGYVMVEAHSEAISVSADTPHKNKKKSVKKKS